MKKNIFISMLMLLCLMSCHKPKPVDSATKIEGRLMDRGSEIPIPNIRARLIEVRSTGSWSTGRSVIQSATSDAKGQFTFDIQWTDDLKGYEVDAVPNDLDKYYDLPFVRGEVKKGQTNKVDVLMQPYGWIKYKIKNINPYDDRDTIRCGAGTFIGKNVDKVAFNKRLKLWTQPDSVGWTVTRNNINISYVKPITLVPHDTVTFEINY